MVGTENYEQNYADLPFENVLRKFRVNNIKRVFERHKPKSILEIGCGMHPLFVDYKNFTHMVVVEPGKMFFEEAIRLANKSTDITLINDFFENSTATLKQYRFDMIIIGGFLHEIDNPEQLLNLVSTICQDKTLVHSYVPNAKSFHRILALEMNAVSSVYQMTELDMLFKRRVVFDKSSFQQLFEKNGFSVSESGSYFIKPFTHDQMNSLLKANILNDQVMVGLDKMINFLPEFGAEIFITAKPTS